MRLGPLIDTHQHPVPDVYKRALAKVGIHGSGENPWPAWSLQSQLELMDELNIAAVVNSVASPGAYFGDVDLAIRIARECNEDAAMMISDHPHRLGAFALLPMPDVAASIREATYALDTLKLEGICLLSHAGERHLGHPDEDELYAELDRRNAVVFVHPLRNQAKNMPDYSYPVGHDRAGARHHARDAQPALERHVRKIPRHPLDHAARRRHHSVPDLPARRDGSQSERPRAAARRQRRRARCAGSGTTSPRSTRRARSSA